MLNIVKNKQAQRDDGIKGVVFGSHKVGKTSLLYTLDPDETLFVNIEAGGLSVAEWDGFRLDTIKTWVDAVNMACWLAGPVETAFDTYSHGHYQYVCEQYGDPQQFLAKFKNIFIDSITVISRLCWDWAKGQPEAFNKHGKPDARSCYGLVGREMTALLTRFQRIPGCNVWLVGLLDKDEETGVYHPQMVGSATGKNLPGIVDQVITMTIMNGKRVFVCKQGNQWGYPAGDRSTKLNGLEPPHLGRLMDKIRNAPSNMLDESCYEMPNVEE